MNEDYMQAARCALQVQGASNLSGAILAFANAVEAVRNRNRELKNGTEWFNRHPIMYLFSVQIVYLTGVCSFADGDYSKNLRICEDLAEGKEVEGY